VSYQPIPGLVALFARAATSINQNPRAPHMRSLSATGFSYVDVVKSPMDGGRFNGVNRGVNQRLSGSLSGHDSGQGSVLNRSGF
jgi:hypothetical protein